MTTTTTPPRAPRNDAGFTLIELMVSVGILMTVSALMMRGTLDMTNLNRKQSNLSEMHAGIRNAEKQLSLLDAPPAEGICRLIRFTWDYYVAHPEFLSLLNS